MMLRLWKKPLLYIVDDILEIFFKSINIFVLETTRLYKSTLQK